MYCYDVERRKIWMSIKLASQGSQLSFPRTNLICYPSYFLSSLSLCPLVLKLVLVLWPVILEHTILVSARTPVELTSSSVRGVAYKAKSRMLIDGFSATAPGISIVTSTDRTAWSYQGLVWPNGASWTDEYTLESNGYGSCFDLTIPSLTHALQQ